MLIRLRKCYNTFEFNLRIQMAGGPLNKLLADAEYAPLTTDEGGGDSDSIVPML